MSQNRLKLKELISGEKSKIFKTSKGVMVADFQEDYSNFNAITGTKSNRYGLRDISKGTLLKNIYFTDEFTRKSAVIKGDNVIYLKSLESSSEADKLFVKPK